MNRDDNDLDIFGILRGIAAKTTASKTSATPTKATQGASRSVATSAAAASTRVPTSGTTAAASTRAPSTSVPPPSSPPPPIGPRMSADRPTPPLLSALSAAARAAGAAATAATMSRAAAAAGNAANTAMKAVAAKVKSTGQRAVVAGKKFTKHHPRGGGKLVSMGQRMQAGATKVRGLAGADPVNPYIITAPPPPKPVDSEVQRHHNYAPSEPSSSSGSGSSAAHGAISHAAIASQVADPSVLYAFSSMQAAANAVAQMAEVGNQIFDQTQRMMTMAQQQPSTALFGESFITTPTSGTYPYGTAMQPAQVNPQPLIDAINSGNAIVDQMNAVIESFTDDPSSETWDPSSSTLSSDPNSTKGYADEAARQASALASQGQAWLQSSQSAMQQFTSGQMTQQAMPFDPGSAGGGGSAGGDSWPDEGADSWPEADQASADQLATPDELEVADTDSELQRFRDSGGDYDPFATEGEAEVALDEGVNPDDDAFWAGDTETGDEPVIDEAQDVYPDDVMGVGFKWQYILAPWMAVQDQNDEDRQRAAAIAAQPSSAAQIAAADAAAQARAQEILSQPAGTGAAAGPTARVSAARRAKVRGMTRRIAYEQARVQEIADQNAAAPVAMEEEVVGNFEVTEAPDIFLQQYEHQITDEPPDFERGRASAHRGAAYLQDVNYPPGGASAGQEGGTMRPEQKIEVLGENALDRHQARRAVRQLSDDDIESAATEAEILGAAAEVAQEMAHLEAVKHDFKKAEVGDIEIFGVQSMYSRGLDSLAGISPIGQRQVARPRAGFTKGATSTSVAKLSFGKVRPGDHKTTIRNAKDAGQRAISVGNKLLTQLKKIPKTMVRGAVAVKRTAASPAVAAGRRKPMSVAQMKKVAQKTIDSGRKLLSQAAKYGNLVNAQAAKAAAARAAVAKALSKAKIKMLATRAPATSAAARNAAARAAGTQAAARVASTSAPLTSASKRAAVSRVTTMLGNDPDALHEYLDAYCEQIQGDLEIEVFGYTGELMGLDPTAGGYYDPATGLPVDDGMMSTGGGYVADPSDPPDPNHPGYLASGKIDPAFGVGANVASDPAVQQIQTEIADFPAMPRSLSDAYAQAYQMKPGTDYELDPGQSMGSPPRTPSSLPLGAVLFDNIPPIKGGSSWGGSGYVNSSAPAVPAGSSGGQSIFASLRRYDGTRGPGFEFTDGDWRRIGADGESHSIDAQDYADINAASVQHGWGPIIGRPDSPYKDLYFYTIKVGNVNEPGAFGAFWFYDKAPDRMKAADNAARLQQAITAWQTDAATLQTQLATAIYDAQVAAEQAIALQKQQALEDAAMQRQYEQEQQANQHQIDMEAAAQSAAEQASFEEQQHQGELEAQAYERASAIADEEQRRQDERDLELARRLDEAQVADAAAAQADYEAAAQGAPPAELPEQYVEAAAEQEGGGEAFDDGNLDEYTDSYYVDAPEEALEGDSDIDVFGEMTEAQKERLRKYLKKILKDTVIRGEAPKPRKRWYQQVMGALGMTSQSDIEIFGAETEAEKRRKAREAAAAILKKVLPTNLRGDEDAHELAKMELEEGGPALTYPRVTGADRIRARREDRR